MAIRVHAFKFQSVVAPTGVIANLYGPVEVGRHDAAILAMSGLVGELEQHSFAPAGEALYIYGDPAFYGVGIQRDCDQFQTHRF